MIYKLTAEHTSGKCVGHCCTTGVKDDPTDQMAELFVRADDPNAAEQIAIKELQKLADEWECDCSRTFFPGCESWWNSVVIEVMEVSKKWIKENAINEKWIVEA